MDTEAKQSGTQAYLHAFQDCISGELNRVLNLDYIGSPDALHLGELKAATALINTYLLGESDATALNMEIKHLERVTTVGREAQQLADHEDARVQRVSIMLLSEMEMGGGPLEVACEEVRTRWDDIVPRLTEAMVSSIEENDHTAWLSGRATTLAAAENVAPAVFNALVQRALDDYS